MPDFDWRQTLQNPLATRFPNTAIGRDEWRDLVEALQQLGPQGDPLPLFDRFLQGATAAARLHATPECRVFVSHRAVVPPKGHDTEFAERIAWLAVTAGYGYWLDVHDPTLKFINAGATIPPPIRDVLIAAIIEIGLLNSSHVIAVMTPNSAGSKWIPYEFGRAKERHVVSRRSAIWLEPGTTAASCGEYVHLGVTTHGEADIGAWLAVPAPCVHAGATWPAAVPKKLP